MYSPVTYFIGGIASDERIFKHQMVAIENAVYLPFPRHDKHDTMDTYVKKFIPLIDTTQPFNLVGNSMGGIMVMELIKHIHPEKVVLISSVKALGTEWTRVSTPTSRSRAINGTHSADFAPLLSAESSSRRNQRSSLLVSGTSAALRR